MAGKVEGGPATRVWVEGGQITTSGGGGGTANVADAAVLAELQKKADLTETQPVLPERKTLAATDSNAPADNTAAVVNYTGIASVYHVIGQITWSYDADPTDGNLKIENSSAVVFTIPITKGGPGQLTFNPPITTGVAQDLKVTLAGAGATVQGTVNVTHWLEA